MEIILPSTASGGMIGLNFSSGVTIEPGSTMVLWYMSSSSSPTGQLFDASGTGYNWGGTQWISNLATTWTPVTLTFNPIYPNDVLQLGIQIGGTFPSSPVTVWIDDVTITLATTSTNTPTQTNTPTPTITFTLTPTPTVTPTPTITLTPTITETPTPSLTPIPGITDITSNINGSCVSGDTTGLTDNYNEVVTQGGPAPYSPVTYGLGAPDIAYSFTLSNPTNLFISVCGASFNSVLYLRTNPADPSTTLALDDNSDYCNTNFSSPSSSSLVTGVLQPGVYFVIVDGVGATDYGTYSLCVSIFSPTCSLTPVATPVALVLPTTTPTDLGTVSVDAVGTGHIDWNFEYTNSWTFTAGVAGTYTISLDCFDDGTGKARVAYDLYDSGNNLLASSNGNTPLDQLMGPLSVQQYTVVVYAYSEGAPSADYRLVIQGPPPTYTPTFTITPCGYPGDTCTPTSTNTPTDTITPCGYPGDTCTPTPNKPPILTVTPPVPFTPTVPAGACTQLANSFETFTGTNPYTTENGSLAPDSNNPTLSQTTTGATDGSNALDIDITNNGGWNQLVDWSGFAQSDFTNVTQILMDVTVDSSLIQTGAGAYNQLALVANPSTWTPITGNIDITTGLQTVVFTVSGAPAQVNDLLLIFNTGGSGTGNIYVDNVRFVYSVCPPTPTPTPNIPANGLWTFGQFGQDGINGDFFGANGIAVDNSGKIYVSDMYMGNIQVFNSNGNYLYNIQPPNPDPWGNAPSPWGLAVDNNGNLFAACYDNGNGLVEEFNTSTGALENMFWGSNDNSVTYIYAPMDVKLDSSGNLWVADFQGGYVAEIDPATDTVLKTSTNSITPVGLAIDTSNTYVYATNPNTGYVTQYDTATLTAQNTFNGSGWTTPLSAPVGIVVTPLGNLIIADINKGVVVNTDTSGNLLATLPVAGNIPYRFPAFDSAGNLYVTTSYVNFQYYYYIGDYVQVIDTGFGYYQ